MIKGGVNAYANVNARVRGMIGTLLQPFDFARINACVDLTCLISNLKDTAYKPYLSDIKENTLTSRRISYEIRKKLTHAFKTIIKSSPDFAQPLIRQLFLIYEVDNLKAILRGIQIADGWEKIRYMLFPMENYPTLPYERMVGVGNIESAIEVIRGTPYYRVLSLALPRYRSENSLFPLEVALDLNYWQLVWQLVNALPHQDKEIARKIMGMYIDKNNLTWAARYRLYHHLSEVEIINYTLPFGYKIDDTIIRAIATGRDLTDVVVNVYPPIAQMLEVGGIDAHELPIIEITLTRMILSACKSAFTGTTFNIGFLMAFLFLLEIEIQDLTVLIEAKSLGIQTDRYIPYMINSINVAVGS
jgi:V/A-type H+-transporting ATPase subunit C